MIRLVHDEERISVAAEAVLLLDRYIHRIHHIPLSAHGGSAHEVDALRRIKVGQHGGRQVNVVRRVDELVGPAAELLEVAIRADACLEGSHDGCSDSDDLRLIVARLIDDVAALSGDIHLLVFYLILADRLYLDLLVAGEVVVQCEEGEVAAL